MRRVYEEDGTYQDIAQPGTLTSYKRQLGLTPLCRVDMKIVSINGETHTMLVDPEAHKKDKHLNRKASDVFGATWPHLPIVRLFGPVLICPIGEAK